MSSSSYTSIFKSSAMIGGARLITLIIGLVRTKFAAVLLGTSGVGLIGTFQSLQQLVTAVASLGINQSGVREIAQARGEGDEQRIASTVCTLRRACLLLGVIGGLLLSAISVPLSLLTFEDKSYALSITLLGASVLFSLISAAQIAILQAFRRIRQMALSSVLGAVIGSVAAVIWYWFLGLDGIVPALVNVSFFTMLVSWLFARRVKTSRCKLARSEFLNQVYDLLGLGLAFMWNGMIMSGVAYAIRFLILNEYDLSQVGIFTAAYAISGMIVNFIINAMSGDFVPRLSEASTQWDRMVRIVNEQTEVGVLMALPGIAFVIVCAPWLVRVFYSNDFAGAEDLVRWFGLGCFARVFQWPLGYILLALKKARLYATLQTLFACVHLSLVFVGLKFFGVEGVSIAFVAYNIITFCVLILISKSIVHYSWSPEALRLIIRSNVFLVLIFLTSYSNDSVWLMLFLLCVVVFVSILCMRALYSRVGGIPRLNSALSVLPFWFRRLILPGQTPIP